MSAERAYDRPYQLAHMAGCSQPDAPESPGAVWLIQVSTYLEDVVEAIEAGQDRGGALWTAAWEVVPVYEPRCWQVFVDLRSWEEDISPDLGPFESMTDQAGAALGQIARRLLEELLKQQQQEDALDSADRGVL
jgi:hypothetical protein